MAKSRGVFCLCRPQYVVKDEIVENTGLLPELASIAARLCGVHTCKRHIIGTMKPVHPRSDHNSVFLWSLLHIQQVAYLQNILCTYRR